MPAGWKILARTAKRLVDQRGGVDALKEDAEELKKIAKSDASFGAKAGAAVKAIKDAGAAEKPAPDADAQPGAAPDAGAAKTQPAPAAGAATQPEPVPGAGAATDAPERQA